MLKQNGLSPKLALLCTAIRAFPRYLRVTWGDVQNAERLRIRRDLGDLLWLGRVTDIPQVAGALAPRRLVSLTKPPESFEHARAIYKLGALLGILSSHPACRRRLRFGNIPLRIPNPEAVS